MTLRDQHVLITGGSSGIGLALARQAAADKGRELASDAGEKAVEYRDVVADKVKEHPLAAVGIALARFVVEFYREPDAQLSEFAMRTGLSMGQWLTIPLIVAGIGLVVWSLMRPPLGSNYTPPAD